MLGRLVTLRAKAKSFVSHRFSVRYPCGLRHRQRAHILSMETGSRLVMRDGDNNTGCCRIPRRREHCGGQTRTDGVRISSWPAPGRHSSRAAADHRPGPRWRRQCAAPGDPRSSTMTMMRSNWWSALGRHPGLPENDHRPDPAPARCGASLRPASDRRVNPQYRQRAYALIKVRRLHEG